MAMTLLPRFLALKSGGKYLTVPENLQEGLPSGFLKFDEQQMCSPRVKFAVEPAETGDGRFVHIRSCYNNKYWVAHRIQQLLWIVAAGDEPEEDRLIDSCTLFEPITNSGDGTVRLRHVKTGIPLIDKPPTDPCIEQWMCHAVELYSASCGTLLNVIETQVILPSSQRPYQTLDESGLEVGDPRGPAMAMTLLPSFLVLKSRGKYLTVPGNLHENMPSGFLKFDEEKIWSPRVKFAVEQAETGDGRFVHIRSCYNNKYWVAHRIQQLLWIVAAGDKPEEDRSRDKCTLFEPFTSPGNGTICFRHVQTGKTLINKSPGLGPVVPSWMFQGVEVSSASTGTVFDVIDWREKLVILPSPHISFRTTFAERNGNYLYSRTAGQGQYQFLDDSGVQAGDLRVAKDLFPTPDGNYRIKDVYFEKFWKRNDDDIWADGEDNDNSNDTIFSIVKISDNVIALRNLGNNNFCGAFDYCCLNVEYPDMTSEETRLMVEERVLRRQISDVRYRLSDSRIYQEEIKEVEHAFATNDSPEHESSVTLTYSPSDSKTTHWTNSVSITFGVSVTFTTDIIPLIADGKVEESTEVGNSYTWGVSQTTERTREVSYVVVVPPLRTIKVTLMCKKANYDVPFSYVQHDLLTTGERVTTPKDDGLFTGHNSYSFYLDWSEVTN